MSFTSHLITGTLLFAIAFIAESPKVAGAPRSLSRENEYRQQQQADQTLQLDPLTDLEALRQQQQQQRLRNQSFLVPKQSTPNNNYNDEPDVAALVQRASLPLIRSQRSFSPNPQASAPFQSTTNQQLLGDEQILKRQLPDLITQARNDKDVERVLLRMLFNASLRPNLANVVAPHDYGSYYNGAGTTGNQLSGSHGWQDILEGGSFENNAISPRMSAHLEQVTDTLGTNSLANDLVQAYRQDQFPAYIDKREYNKPCSFNMVSCAKNPFRRL